MKGRQLTFAAIGERGAKPTEPDIQLLGRSNQHGKQTETAIAKRLLEKLPDVTSGCGQFPIRLQYLGCCRRDECSI